MSATPTPAAGSGTAMLDDRLSAVREKLASARWDAALVLDPVDIRYLTGLTSSNAAVLVGESEAIVFTDFRYVAEARQLPAPWRVEMLSQALHGSLGPLLGAHGGLVAYEPASLSHQDFLALTANLDESVTLRATETILGPLRARKDEHELDAIRRAAALLVEAYEMVVRDGLVGRTEAEVAWRIERLLRDGGAERMSFDPIVAAGPGGAEAHHTPGCDPIPADTLVTIDIGCVVDGYASDCTRTFATGQPSPDLLGIHAITLRAQLAGLEAIRPGAVCRNVDAAARAVIEEAGHGEHFGHGLGHGVGLDVHEEPRLNRTSESVLEAGMVVTVEPGIYVEGLGGCRIEDLVIVADEPEVLTTFTKELVTVG